MSTTPNPTTAVRPLLPEPKFPLGQLVATPAALDCLAQAGVSVFDILSRHVTGDWGNVCDEDRQANDLALQTGDRLLSVFHLGGSKLYVISEAGRVATTLLMAEEY